MADPRIYLAPQSPLCKNVAVTQQTSVGNFINSIGKIGDIAALNSVGGGSIGAGLRNLTNISNAIRSGTGVLPSSITSSLETGTNWVLQSTGIAPTTIAALQQLNPTAANSAYGQAQQIYNQIKGGVFTSDNIPAALQELQNAASLASKIYTPANAGSNTYQMCYTSPYAMDLIARAPKHKFMFVVSFVFEDGYTQALSTVDFAFVIHDSTRPSVKFKTRDINYYNYHTHVPVRTEFDPMKMTFYDDMTNNVSRFMTAYMNIIAPVSNIPDSVSNTNVSSTDWTIQTALQGSLSPISVGSYAGSRGPFMKDVPNPIKSIRLFHVFDGGRTMNVYQFKNPWITELSSDDVTMDGGINHGTVSFIYDSVYVDLDVPFNSQLYNVTSTTQSNAMFPLRDSFDSATTSSNQTPTTAPPVSIPSALNTLSTISSSSGGSIASAIKQDVAASLTSV